jgi:hypothetical protein
MRQLLKKSWSVARRWSQRTLKADLMETDAFTAHFLHNIRIMERLLLSNFSRMDCVGSNLTQEDRNR